MNLSPLPIQKFFDNAGRPLNGGLLFTYVTGTNTKLATYTDSTGGTPNTNPIRLDFRGEARIWLDQTLTYRFVLAPENDTDPPTAPIWSVDGITTSITYATLLSIIGQILWPRSAEEIATGIVPINYGYIWGDPRRYHLISVSQEELAGLYCHGFVPTYVDSDTFTVPGNATAIWPVRTRIAVFGASGGRQYVQVLTIGFAAGITTVDIRTETGNLPTDPVAILKYVGVQLAHLNTFMMDYDGSQVMQVINKATSANAATQLFVGDFVNSGIAMIGTKPTTTPSPYYGLAPNNPLSAVTNGLSIPMALVTHDVCRLILDGDGLASQFTTDLTVQHQNAGFPNAASTSKLSIDGTGTAYLSLKVAGVEQGVYTTDASALTFGSVRAIPVNFFSNSTLRASIDAAGNIVAGPAAGAISTSATDGFLYIPTCAGTPTGVPTSKSGMAPMVVDATNNRLYFYSSGSWRNAGP